MTNASGILAPLICIGSSALQVRASPDLVAFDYQHSPAQAECCMLDFDLHDTVVLQET